MNRYQIVTQNERNVIKHAEAIHRDGDWIMLTVTAPQMESRRIDHPPSTEYPQGRIENVMVATGRVQQQPIAYFYKPTSVEFIGTAEAKEPSNGDDA